MRILILSQFYPPEPDPWMHRLAKGMTARGHRVSVMTAFPNWPLGWIFDGYRQGLWRVEMIDGVRVIRLPLFPDHSGSAVRRAANYLSFAVSATKLGPFLSGRADCVFVYHPPATLAIPGILIAALQGAPLIYQVQDMWPETLPATGMVRSRLLLSAVGALCNLAYRRARAITVHAPGQVQNLVSKGVPAEKIHFIPNSAYEDTFTPRGPDPELAARLGLTGRFNIVYAGNIGPAQGLSNVLDAAALLGDLPAVQFVLMGDGIERAALETNAARREIRNVRFVGRMPLEAMPSVYALADALLIHLKLDPLFEMTIPGKTQSYLLSGRPILCSVAGDTATLVENAGAGVLARPGDARDLARAVRDLFGMSSERRNRMGELGRAYYLSHMSPEILFERYDTLFRAVASAGPSR